MRILTEAHRLSIGGVNLLSQVLRVFVESPAVTRITVVTTMHAQQAESLYALRSPKLIIRDLSDTVKAVKQARRIFGIPGTGRVRHLIRTQSLSMDWLQPARKLLTTLAQEHDLFYAVWPHQISYPALSLPVVCTIQDLTVLDFPELLDVTALQTERATTAEWLQRAARVVVPSLAVRDSVVRQFPDLATPEYITGRVALIRHAILPWSVAARQAGLDTRQAASTYAHLGQYFIAPINVVAHKNIDLLLYAWARFADRARYPLVITGSGTHGLNAPTPSRDYMTRRAQGIITRTGLVPGQDIFALGAVSDADFVWLLQHAHGMIMPSLAEGGGSYPVEEALALGVPVLCSNLPVIHEQVDQRTAKIAWFDPVSVESIIRAVQDVITHHDGYQQAAQRAMHDPRPTWESIGRAYIALFESVLESADKVRSNPVGRL